MQHFSLSQHRNHRLRRCRFPSRARGGPDQDRRRRRLPLRPAHTRVPSWSGTGKKPFTLST